MTDYDRRLTTESDTICLKTFLKGVAFSPAGTGTIIWLPSDVSLTSKVGKSCEDLSPPASGGAGLSKMGRRSSPPDPGVDGLLPAPEELLPKNIFYVFNVRKVERHYPHIDL